MNTDRFWEIIDVTAAASTPDEQLDLFRHELRQLSLAELASFCHLFAERRFAAYNWELWLVAWLCQGGLCSDDSFEYFRNWLVSRGRSVYESALNDPESIAQLVRETRSPSFESFGYVPGQVYRERAAAEDMPDTGLRHPRQPSGGDWLRPELKDRSKSKLLNLCIVFNELTGEDWATIEQRFPRLWAYCLEQGIIKYQDPNAPPPEPSVADKILESVRAAVDPELMKTDMNAYLKAFTEAVRKANAEHRKKEGDG